MAFCTPFGYRVAPRRHLPVVAPSFFPSSSVFAPSAVSADIGSLLRIFDELDSVSRSSQRQQHQHRQQVRAWQPRFDVREEQDAFHLQGDLPGVAQDELNIEFTGPNTLAVSGTTVRERQSGNQPDALTASTSTETQDNATRNTETAEVSANQQQQQQQQEQQPERPVSPASSHSSNYQRPSVEEERDEDDEWTEAVPTPATTTTNTVTATETAKPAAPEEQPQQAEDKQVEQQQGRYWVSERSVGTFKRTFNFPGQIDQDAVTASLKDGVLSITVPKQRIELRKISVQ